MPKPEAVRRGEVVVDQVVAAIRSASSLQASVDGWPDRELGTGRYPAELTVEAVLRLSDGHREVLWAADVMGVGWNPLLGPARSGLENRLEERMHALAEAREHSIAVMYKLPVGHRDKGVAYCDAIVNYATALLDGMAAPAISILSRSTPIPRSKSTTPPRRLVRSESFFFVACPTL